MHIKQMLIITMTAFIGSEISNFLHLPIPAAVIGLILLFAALVLKIIKLKDVEETAAFIINNLSIFFIVPTVGIMLYIDIIKEQMFQILIPLLTSIVLGMFAAGKVTEVMIHIMNQKKEDTGNSEEQQKMNSEGEPS